ncbi:cohesin domain-containing protein [Methanosarcina sp.]|uniref:cohesin domain-containing protein n=1 Tax=Methanosarcina sp. TaxID=2213 RepID=UPI002ABC61F5|nr:cohesin domain-containing protein [Methanosarcina sp.]MDY9925886.1 cohesin domain-containing protein [Methanosarcina sp.]
MKKKLWKGLERSAFFGICFAALIAAFAAVPVQAQQATVSIDTPEIVEGSTVYATVNIDSVENLDAGQFDLVFNPDVLKIVGVENGSIGEAEVPVQWRSVDNGKVRVIFNLEGVTGVSGSGQLASVGLEVIGGGKGDLRISNGLLGDTEAHSINTDWGVTEASGIGADLRDAEAEDTQKAASGFEAVLTLIGLTTAMYLARSGQR